MPYKFFYLDHFSLASSRNAVIEDEPESIEDTSDRINDGIPLGNAFIDHNEGFGVDPNLGEILLDIPPTTCLMYLISKRVKDVWDEEGVDNVEYHQASINNKRGEFRTSDYFVPNVLGTVECIDKDRSVADEGAIVTGNGVLAGQLKGIELLHVVVFVLHFLVAKESRIFGFHIAI